MNTYITTPIYYASGSPHLGHAYTTLLADAYGRFRKLQGDEVLLLTGTDEHGQKIERTALRRGIAVESFVDGISAEFRALWRDLEIDVDIFQRTTDHQHKDVVLTFWQSLKDKDDIYQGDYSGLYCVECEQYFTAGSHCPVHRVELEQFSERCWFFRLSKYQQELISHIEANPSFIVPVQRRNEVLSFLKLNPLRDLAVSRGSTQWGIPVPGDQDPQTNGHVLYVWVDALVTYLSGLDAAIEPEALPDWWSGTRHFIGKDILIFHAVYWPALLLSAGYSLPASLVVNGWLTVESEKISKSRPATVIDPRELADEVGTDGLRHYLFSRVSLGQDLDFSLEQVVEVVNTDLANNIGNLVSRVVGLVKKYEGGVLTAPPVALIENPSNKSGSELSALSHKTAEEFAGYLNDYEFAHASRTVVTLSSGINAWLQQREPWKLDDADARWEVLWQACTALADLSILLTPLVPGIAGRIRSALGLSRIVSWTDLHLPKERFDVDLEGPVFQRREKAEN